jgi:hypothetical protein
MHKNDLCRLTVVWSGDRVGSHTFALHFCHEGFTCQFGFATRGYIQNPQLDRSQPVLCGDAQKKNLCCVVAT